MAENLILDDETGQIEIVLAVAVAANQLEVTTNWADKTSSALTYGNTITVTNDDTEVTIVAAPGASTQRLVKEITVYNADTAAATFTILHESSATERRYFEVTIPAGRTWTMTGGFADGQGIAIGEAFIHITDAADKTSSALTYGNTITVTNDDTEVTIVAAPGASTQRLVKEITVYNADTAAATFTIL
ncbi:unnamed protein product, partial [marine sediment metagenome]